MSTTDYSDILAFIDTHFQALCRDRIDPWFSYDDKQFSVEGYEGRTYNYQDMPYDKAPRDDFWDAAYIDPFLIELCEQVICLAAKNHGNSSEEKRRALLRTEMWLYDATNKVLEQMAQMDQVLMKKSGHAEARRRPIDSEESRITEWISSRIAELTPKPRRDFSGIIKKATIVGILSLIILATLKLLSSQG